MNMKLLVVAVCATLALCGDSGPPAHLLSRAVEVHRGVAPRYSPKLMAKVSARRGLPVVGCMVSSPYWKVGTWVYVYGYNTNQLEYCRVTDVSAPKDRARHLRTGRVAELGYEEARRLCGAKHLNDPPSKCPILVFRLGDA